MMTEYLLILLFLIFIVLSAFFAIMRILFENTNALTLREKTILQSKISKSKEMQQIIHLRTCKKIAEKLKLSIVEVRSEVLGNKESCLRPSRDDKYLGEIDIPSDLMIDDDLKNFRCFHEIAHYILDVGSGNQVSKEYGKDRTGETKSHKEQIINFYAAAIAIPQEELLDDLATFADGTKEYDAFLEDMKKKYRQPKEMISRRIEEVKYINCIS